MLCMVLLLPHQTLGARFDHIFQAQSIPESDILERAIQPLVTSCVEGVNVAVLAIGSSAARENGGLFAALSGQSLSTAAFQAIRSELDDRASRYAGTKSPVAANTFSSQPLATNPRVIALRYSLRISFAEIHQESITVRRLQSTFGLVAASYSVLVVLLLRAGPSCTT